MTSTITQDQQNKIGDLISSVQIGWGRGSKENPCSISAINLALSGKLTDTIPACMSDTVGSWIIPIQDQMPDKIRNSKEWREILPFAAGTGKEMEGERAAIILDWMWEEVLPRLQKIADNDGFGDEWSAMCRDKTFTAAANAADSAAANADIAANAADIATDIADFAANATDIADIAVDIAVDIAAHIANTAAICGLDSDEFWEKIDPPGLLKKLVMLEVSK